MCCVVLCRVGVKLWLFGVVSALCWDLLLSCCVVLCVCVVAFCCGVLCDFFLLLSCDFLLRCVGMFCVELCCVILRCVGMRCCCVVLCCVVMLWVCWVTSDCFVLCRYMCCCVVLCCVGVGVGVVLSYGLRCCVMWCGCG